MHIFKLEVASRRVRRNYCRLTRDLPTWRFLFPSQFGLLILVYLNLFSVKIYYFIKLCSCHLLLNFKLQKYGYFMVQGPVSHLSPKRLPADLRYRIPLHIESTRTSIQMHGIPFEYLVLNGIVIFFFLIWSLGFLNIIFMICNHENTGYILLSHLRI